MDEIPLQEYYEIGGLTVPITRKTGRLVAKRRDGGYEFSRDDGGDGMRGAVGSSDEDGPARFSITADVNLEHDIGLSTNHRVTMALFENGGFFLLLNHDNGRHHYYPGAVEDLLFRLNRTQSGLLRELRNQRMLSGEAKTFAASRVFLSTLDKCRLL